MIGRYFGLTFRNPRSGADAAIDAAAGSGAVDVELCPSATRDYDDRDGVLRFSSAATDAAGRPQLQIHELAQGTCFRLAYSDGTTFVVDRGGSWVRGSWSTDATPGDAMFYLLGPVAGTLLHLRGVTCLHASAVVVDGKALLFIGAPEAGKSTTAAAFARRGFRVLTDDIAALGEDEGGFKVQPGVPRILLWPPSVQALWGTPDALPLYLQNWDRRYLDLAGTGLYQESPVPLAAVYVLEERQADRKLDISPLRGAEAFMRLIANKYFTRLAIPRLQAQEFATLSRLQQQVPVRRVLRPDDRGGLDALCGRILDDIAAVSAPHRIADESCV